MTKEYVLPNAYCASLVRTIRNELGLSQTQLARRVASQGTKESLGMTVDQALISRIECASHRFPRSIYLAIYNALSEHPKSEILKWVGEDSPKGKLATTQIDNISCYWESDLGPLYERINNTFLGAEFPVKREIWEGLEALAIKYCPGNEDE